MEYQTNPAEKRGGMKGTGDGSNHIEPPFKYRKSRHAALNFIMGSVSVFL
jgi:hypothetical protein